MLNIRVVKLFFRKSISQGFTAVCYSGEEVEYTKNPLRMVKLCRKMVGGHRHVPADFFPTFIPGTYFAVPSSNVMKRRGEQIFIFFSSSSSSSSCGGGSSSSSSCGGGGGGGSSSSSSSSSSKSIDGIHPRGPVGH